MLRRRSRCLGRVQRLAATQADDHIRALVPGDLCDARRFRLGRVAAEFDVHGFQRRGLQAGEHALAQEAFHASIPQDQGPLAHFADVDAGFAQQVAALQVFSRSDKGEVHGDDPMTGLMLSQNLTFASVNRTASPVWKVENSVKIAPCGPACIQCFSSGRADTRDLAHAQDSLALHGDVGGLGVLQLRAHVGRGSALGVGVDFAAADQPDFHFLRDVSHLHVPVLRNDLARQQVGIQPRVIVFLVTMPDDHSHAYVREPPQTEVGNEDLLGDDVVDGVAALPEEVQIDAFGGFRVEFAARVVELFVIQPGEPATSAA